MVSAASRVKLLREAIGKEDRMEPTIKCGKQVAENANLAGSTFHDVNLSDAVFDDVNMSRVRFHNINLSDIDVSAVQMGGAHFKHFGLPPGSRGKQRPITFEEGDLAGSTIARCDLSNLRIEECQLEGMTIDGIAVTELLAAYRRQ